jgi:hypothetical protein
MRVGIKARIMRMSTVALIVIFLMVVPGAVMERIVYQRLEEIRGEIRRKYELRYCPGRRGSSGNAPLVHHGLVYIPGKLPQEAYWNCNCSEICSSVISPIIFRT